MISENVFEKLKKSREISKVDVGNHIFRGNQLPDHSRNWLELAGSDDQLFIEASRRHFKSRTFSVIYPLYRIIKDPEINILIASKTISQAKKWLREIRSNLRESSPYSFLKPDQPEKWTENEIIVDRVDASADPTVSTTGVGKEILGSGADLVICDDIVSKRNSHTKQQRDKLEDWFYSELFPMIEGDGEIITVGTPWHKEDLYALLREDPSWKHYKFPAEEPDDPEPYHSDFYNNPDNVLWFPKWNKDALQEKRKKMGTNYYAMSFLLDLTEVEGGIIDPDWIEWFGSLPEEENFSYMMGVDPSIGETDESDFTGIVTVARSKESGKIYVVDADQGRWRSQERIEKIKEKYQRFPISKIAIEDVSVTKDFIDMLRRDTMLPIDPISPGGKDKVARLETISPRIENADIIFNLSLKRSKVPFYDQLIEFPQGSYDDLVDAFVYAVWEFVEDVGDGIFELFRGDIR